MKNGILKFILSGIGFLFLFIIIDHSIGYGLQYIERNVREINPGVGSVKTSFVCEIIDSDVLIIGSSRAEHHYVPNVMKQSLSLSVFNCGVDGSFFLYQTAVIQHVIQRYLPKLIIWDVEPIVFMKGVNDVDDVSRLSRLNSFYDTDSYIHDIIQIKSEFEKYKMYSMTYRYNYHIHDFFDALSTKKNKLNGYKPLYGTDKTLAQPEKRQIENIYYQENVELFKRILELCSQKKVPLVISFSPRFTDDNAFDTIQYKKLFEVANEYNVPIINFYHHPDFMFNPTLFKDVNHLNDDGAKLFTERFCEELEKLEILKSAQTNN